MHATPTSQTRPARDRGRSTAVRPKAGFSDGVFPQLLDDIYERLSRDASQDVVNRSLDKLIVSLRSHKLEVEPQQWDGLVDTCRQHPLREIIHTDPFTRRAFDKPRGYAGDAKLLDFIYGREEQWPAPKASSIGRRIFDYTTAAPAPSGVRARRGFVADLIDRLAEDSQKPHILSIAAGHLREASVSAAVQRREIGRLVALDADSESLREVEKCYSSFGVETVEARIRGLLTNRLDVGKFDLVYSTGLFDYMQQPIGRRLVSNMFEMLRPGGRVVVANFLPAVRDVGYMEVYMDWFLIYRTRHDMIDLTMEIPEEEIREITMFTEDNQNVTFLQVQKK